MMLGLLLFACLLLADGVFNWGLFKNSRKTPLFGKRRSDYGPVERPLRVVVGFAAVIAALMASLVSVLKGGPRALIFTHEYAGSSAPEPTPPPVVQRPAPRETPPVEPVRAASPETDTDFQFYVYEDASGRTHMVDRPEKVPEAFRASARKLGAR